MKKTAPTDKEAKNEVKGDTLEDLFPKDKKQDKEVIEEVKATGSPEKLKVGIDDNKEPEEPENKPVSSSFYEKVMGEKPPKKRDDISNEARRINTKLFLLGGFVFVLTVLVSSMVWLSVLNTSKKIKMAPDAVSTKIMTTPSPTVEPASNFSRVEWSFEVLNGGNTPGAAAKAADKIKALGYKVSKVGNANDNVDSNTIFISQDATATDKKKITDDLKGDFGDLTFSDSLPDLKKTVRLIISGK